MIGLDLVGHAQRRSGLLHSRLSALELERATIDGHSFAGGLVDGLGLAAPTALTFVADGRA